VKSSTWSKFQSAPAQLSGRYQIEQLAGKDATVSIRARPTERAIPAPPGNRCDAQKVSIRARPTERAIPPLNDLLNTSTMFQSAPAQLSGRYLIKIRLRRRNRVSIRARPTERAIPNSFESAISVPEFQSAPAQLSGRYAYFFDMRLSFHSFNPRPPN